MPRLVRPPLVALLAALAALLASLGASAAGSAVVAAARHAVAGATQTTGQAPLGRVTAGRELRDSAVRRVQHGSTQVRGVVAGAERAGQSGPGHVPVGVLAAAVLLLAAAACSVRRVGSGRAPAGRTTGLRHGRGPPALARA